MKKFTRRDLMQKLGYKDFEADIIMKAQNQFPELLTLDNDVEGFVVDTRNLHDKLEVGKRYTTWIQGRIEKYGFVENVDYQLIWYAPKTGNVVEFNGNINSMVKQGYESIYKATLDMAKELCMIEKNEQGKLCRKYFILMEKAVKRMSEWMIVREPEKQGYKEMCVAIDESYRRLHDGKTTNQFVYANNADLINTSLIGLKSKQLKNILNAKYYEPLRDSLIKEFNEAIYQLQIFNCNLLNSDLDFQTRKVLIEGLCNRKYMGIRLRFSKEFASEIAKAKSEN